MKVLLCFIFILCTSSFTQASSIYFTFDDGCSIHSTRVAQEFNKRGGKATFFIIGEKMNGFCMKTLSGHVIGSHSNQHKIVSEMTVKQIENDVQTMNAKLKGFTYFRPPFLNYTQTGVEAINGLGKKFSVPTIDCPDWLWKDDDKIVQCVLSKAHDKGVVMLHEEFSSKAISKILDGLKGWEFKGLDGNETNGVYKYTLPEKIKSNLVIKIDSKMKFGNGVVSKNCTSDDLFAGTCNRGK